MSNVQIVASVSNQSRIKFFTTNAFECLFMLLLVVLSFAPERIFQIGEMQISLRNLWIPISCLLLSPILLFKSTVSRAQRMVFLLFTAIIVYAFISLLWSTESGFGGYSAFTLTMSWIAMVMGYLVCKMTPYRNWEQFATRLALLLSIVFTLYAVFYLTSNDTMGRLRGPLGGAAVIHCIMLPTLAIHIANLKERRKPYIASWAAFILTAFCILMTGSRIGVLSMVLMLLVLFGRKIKSFILLLVASAIVYLLANSLLSFSRFASLEDNVRKISYENSWLMATESFNKFVFGYGYGNVWPWIQYENSVSLNDVGRLIASDYGPILYHAHSVFFELLVEMGFISVVPFVSIIAVLLYSAIKSRFDSSAMRKYLLIGMVFTFPSFFVDLYLFKNWQISAIWWIFLFLAIRTPKGSK